MAYTLYPQTQSWQQAQQTLPSDFADLAIFGVIIASDDLLDGDMLMRTWTQDKPNWQWQAKPLDRKDGIQIHQDETVAIKHLYHYLLGVPNGDEATVAKASLATLLTNLPADIYVLPIDKLNKPHALACFDMDSTLIKQEVIVELAKFCQVETQVFEITEQAMRGEIDFATSFKNRVALLAGAKDSIVPEIIANNIELQPSAKTTLYALKQLGYHTVLISGGFEPFAEYVATTLGMDEFYANPLHIQDGRLTGEVSEPILDGTQKSIITQTVAKTKNLPLDQVICVGDGANDLAMMAVSDLGIAYRAKPVVQAQADTAINNAGLDGVLYALGHLLVAE